MSDQPHSPGGGLPDYFAMFQSLLKPAAAKGVESMAAMFDAKELDKKINELEIVIAWMRGTTKVLETSVEAMRVQKKFVESVAGAAGGKSSAKSGAKSTSPTPDFSRLVDALNPAAWAANLSQTVAQTTQSSSKRTGKRRSSA
jgi:hypothetical protein